MRARRIADLIIEAIRSGSIDGPERDEKEPAFTARALTPVIASLFRRREIRELAVGGDGGGPVPRVYFLGTEMRPDIAINLYSERLVAIEVKLFRGGRIADIVCRALGQALLYRASGYDLVLVLIVLVNVEATIADIERARELFDGSERIQLLFARVRQAHLSWIGS